MALIQFSQFFLVERNPTRLKKESSEVFIFTWEHGHVSQLVILKNVAFGAAQLIPENSGT